MGDVRMNDSQRRLAEENHNLIYTFLKQRGLSIERWYGLAAIGLCKAAQEYDPEKGKFSTIAFTCMSNTIWYEQRRERARKRISETDEVSLSDMLPGVDDIDYEAVLPANVDVEKDVIMGIMVQDYLKKMKDRDRNILFLLGSGMGQVQVADAIGISQAQVSRVSSAFYSFLAGL